MSFHPTRIVPLEKKHNKAAFKCGVESLDAYLHRQAGQDKKRYAASVYVLEAEDGCTVLGYYTLSAYGIEPSKMPVEFQKDLPRYETLPAYLLGRLAVSESCKGQGLGKFLLVDALNRCLHHQETIAGLAVVVDSIDEKAAAFYQHYGFLALPERPLKLFISMKLVTALFAK